MPQLHFSSFTRLLANRRLQLSLGLLIAGFVVLNSVVYLAYRQRTYPNTTIAGHHLGSLSAIALDKKLPQMQLLPTTVSFQSSSSGETSSTTAKLKTSTLGITPDYSAVQHQAMNARAWLPVSNLWVKHDLTVLLAVEQTAVRSAINSALAGFQQAAADAKISRDNETFTVIPDTSGQNVDAETTGNRIIEALSHGRATVVVAVKPVGAQIKAAMLQADLSKLNAQTKTAIAVHYADKSQRFSATDIANWYSPDKARMSLSDASIQTAINKAAASFGIRVQNLSDATAAIRAAIQNQQSLDFALVAAPKAIRTYSYCVAARGVDQSYLPDLSTKLQSTFADSRGWGLSGLIQFTPATSGCDLTVWLAAANQMSSFGAICDADWSCTVSPYVIINFDRWAGASSAWNAQGGSLQDYRSMVINHETGHWFGFNHAFCGGAGQPAPVMQQQSIDLQGCAFNPWPTASEQNALKSKFGL